MWLTDGNGSLSTIARPHFNRLHKSLPGPPWSLFLGQTALEAQLDHSLVRLDTVEHEIDRPMDSACRGGNVHATDHLPAVHHQGKAVPLRVKTLAGGEFQPDVIRPGSNGEIDDELGSMDPVAIQLRIRRSGDRFLDRTGPPGGSDRVGHGTGWDDELAAGFPGVSGRVHVIAPARVTEEQTLRCPRASAFTKTGLACGVGPLDGIDIDIRSL